MPEKDIKEKEEPVADESVAEEKPRRRHRFIKWVVVPILALILLVVLVAGYFGFVPVVSSLFGSNSPKDLGVVHTEADFNAAQAKLKQEIVEPAGANPYEQMQAGGSSQVTTTLSSEEVSAHNERYYPVSDLQIKLDGSSFEASGKIVRSRIPQYVRTIGLSGASDAEILDVVNKYMPVDPVFYISGTGRASNNQLDLDLSKAQIGRFPVGGSDAAQLVTSYLETVLDQVSGFSVESATIRNGQLHYDGTTSREVPKF